jgi:murein DD-endopeptidase MepM/ murein hydrolase activator NlpD
MKLHPMPKTSSSNVLNIRKRHTPDRNGPGHFMRNFAILCVLILVGLAGFVLLRDGSAPVLKLTPQTGAASYATNFSLDLTSARAGLKDCVITATQDGKRVEVLRRSFSDKQLAHTEAFHLPRVAGFKEGPLELAIVVRDNALLAFLGRGKTSLVQHLTLDFSPPRLSVNPGIHNVNQGGGGLVSYTISKPVERTGVMVGERFFPAFQQKDGQFLCYFAMPYNMAPADFKPKVIAQDKAGNEATQSITVLAIPKVFKSDKLNIPDEFLNDKMSQYSSMYPELKTPLDIYKRVNTELRKQNEADLLKIGQDTSPTPLWTGPFLRLPAAAGRAGFGDQRDYYYNGEKIDHQTHMGVDLASVANAPVPAANAGRIVYAGFFGIYGNCVIIDHGLGLQSLYSHLSEIEVTKGTDVKKGQVIAKTGATGLAGGDHLHFGMIISGLQVSPVEWWDEHWIKDNIIKHMTK